MRHDLSRVLRLVSVMSAFAALAACGGGGGGGNNSPPDTVAVSGTITFDRAPFKVDLGMGLDPVAAVEAPAREVTVEAIDAASRTTVLASTSTDANGDYSLTVPASTSMFIRVRAEMIKTGAAPTWDFSVHNNTNSDALYALEGDDFNSGTANSTRDLNAASGWGTTSYVDEQVRPAAPFAILDTVFQAKELILSASASEDFPALELFWSPDNRNTVGEFCPDDGAVGTTFYVGDGHPIGDIASGTCSPTDELPGGIYILGDFAAGGGDTDEFDQHVISHEFGHYIEDQFSRSDSIGGTHGVNDRVDLRVAFGEGWGNAYSTMTLDDPVYRDSFNGVSEDFFFDLEADLTAGDGIPEGWFSESSVGEILWDIFDGVGGAAEPEDQVDLGFAPIFSVMTGAQVSTNALTSIFSFATALRSANSSSAAAIDDLLAGEDISHTDEFGDGETNDGGDPSVLADGLYQPIFLGMPLADVCSRSTAGSGDTNKLGNRRFLRFENDVSRMVTIEATGQVMDSDPESEAAIDPDIFVYHQGLIKVGDSDSPDHTETISQISLDAGTYIIEVFDFQLPEAVGVPRCMSVSVTGN